MNTEVSKTYIVPRVRGVERTGMIAPCNVEVGEVVGPAPSGVAGDFTDGHEVQPRSGTHLSSSEDITLT